LVILLQKFLFLDSPERGVIARPRGGLVKQSEQAVNCSGVADVLQGPSATGLNQLAQQAYSCYTVGRFGQDLNLFPCDPSQVKEKGVEN